MSGVTGIRIDPHTNDEQGIRDAISKQIVFQIQSECVQPCEFFVGFAESGGVIRETDPVYRRELESRPITSMTDAILCDDMAAFERLHNEWLDSVRSRIKDHFRTATE